MQVDLEKRYERCPVCGLLADRVPAGTIPGKHWWDCIRCGGYFMDTFAAMDLGSTKLTPRQVANISGYLTENSDLYITDKDLEFLRQLTTPTVTERATRLLRCLAKNQPILGHGQDVAGWSMK